jgi:hypothetical protein
LKRSRFLGLFIKPLLDALVVVNRLFLRAHHVLCCRPSRSVEIVA